MANQTFAAQIRDYAAKTKAEMRQILQDSLFDVLEKAQTSQPSVKLTGGSFEIGKIPVDSSNLIRSLASELNGSELARGEASFTVVIEKMEAGDTALFSWTAPYAKAIEYGWETSTGKHVGGRHFVGHNAAQWPRICAANTERIAGK